MVKSTAKLQVTGLSEPMSFEQAKKLVLDAGEMKKAMRRFDNHHVDTIAITRKFDGLYRLSHTRPRKAIISSGKSAKWQVFELDKSGLELPTDDLL